ncbi:MAG: ATP-binding protein [bacterium]|nr:ATP-binding protein [bacterium]
MNYQLDYIQFVIGALNIFSCSWIWENYRSTMRKSLSKLLIAGLLLHGLLAWSLVFKSLPNSNNNLPTYLSLLDYAPSCLWPQLSLTVTILVTAYFWIRPPFVPVFRITHRSKWDKTVAIMIVAIIAGTYPLTEWRTELSDRTQKKGMLFQAEAIAHQIDIDKIHSLAFTNDDRTNQNFLIIEEQMRSYAQAAGIRSIYSITEKENKLLFGPENLASDDPLASAPGTIYEQPPKALWEVLKTRNPQVEGPYQDEYGTFISAFAPIIDRESNELLLVIGIDREARSWRETITRTRMNTIAFAMLFITTVIIGDLAIKYSRTYAPGNVKKYKHTEGWATAAIGLLLTAGAVFLASDSEQRSNAEIFSGLAELRFNTLTNTTSSIEHTSLTHLKNTLLVSSVTDLSTESLRKILPRTTPPVLGWGVIASQEECTRQSPLNSDCTWNSPDKARKFNLILSSYPAETCEDEAMCNGFDHANDANRLATIHAAISSKLTSASDPLPIRQFKKSGLGTQIYLAAEANLTTKHSILATALLSYHDLVNDYLSSSQNTFSTIKLYQLDQGDNKRFLASSTTSNSSANNPDETTPLDKDPLTISFPLFAFNNSYQILISPSQKFHPANDRHLTLVVTSVGLLFTFAFSLMIGTLATHRTNLENEVRERVNELQVSEQSYTRQFYDNRAVMLLIDPKSQQIIDANNAAAEFYGYSREALKNMHIADLNLLSKEEVSSAIDRIRNSQAHQFEFRHKLASGEMRDVTVSSSLITLNGRQTVHSIVTDITSRKEAEKKLVANNLELEKASRAKSEFLANMSHEIRTPMSGVLGMLNLLRDTGLTFEQKELCSMAQSSANNLLTIINDILDLSKIESGKLVITPSSFDLRYELKEIEEIFRLSASSKSITLINDISPTIPVYLIGDQVRIRQIIINLVANAVKFTDEGMSVILRADLPELTETTANLRISVIDSGIGIRLESQSKIFEAFEQADTSTTRRYGGTGLGLTITNRLVKLMGGQISVNSIPGSGSAFTVILPLKIDPTVPENGVPYKIDTPLENVKASLANMRILVVDDNSTNQQLASRILKKEGVDVILADSGEQAISLLKHEKVDLVLMDIQMPGMDGVAALKAWRHQEQTTSNLPFIALTAHAIIGDREKYLAEGFNAFISKPYNKNDLLQTIVRIRNRTL